ncbi:MAG: hypothetical protein ACEY3J_03760 [Arsenophonus sp.]
MKIVSHQLSVAIPTFTFTIWLLRDLLILVFFSDMFIAMHDLFVCQLIDDGLKVEACVFGYLVITTKGRIMGLHFNGSD